MRSLHDLKPYLQKYLTPVAKKLIDRDVFPVQLMLIACGLSLVVGIIMAALAPVSIAIFLLLPLALGARLLLNAIDEILIKKLKKKSKYAFYLSEMTDVFSDVVLYLPFLYVPDISQVLVVFNVFAAIFTEFAGVLGVGVTQARRNQGPMGKVDRAVAFSVVAIVYGFGLLDAGAVNFLLTVIFLAQALTIYNRVIAAVGVKA
jgi:CDP-diacylglycerol--glycerol-3-phosphate 3-phosphatidyltransferase